MYLKVSAEDDAPVRIHSLSDISALALPPAVGCSTSDSFRYSASSPRPACARSCGLGSWWELAVYRQTDSRIVLISALVLILCAYLGKTPGYAQHSFLLQNSDTTAECHMCCANSILQNVHCIDLNSQWLTDGLIVQFNERLDLLTYTLDFEVVIEPVAPSGGVLEGMIFW